MERPYSSFTDELRVLSYVPTLPVRDIRLYQNDPAVHNMARMLEHMIEEYGVLQVSAAYRLAVALNAERYRMERAGL